MFTVYKKEKKETTLEKLLKKKTKTAPANLHTKLSF